jgi:hypothetical protein
VINPEFKRFVVRENAGKCMFQVKAWYSSRFTPSSEDLSMVAQSAFDWWGAFHVPSRHLEIEFKIIRRVTSGRIG